MLFYFLVKSNLESEFQLNLNLLSLPKVDQVSRREREQKIGMGESFTLREKKSLVLAAAFFLLVASFVIVPRASLGTQLPHNVCGGIAK